MASNLIKKRKFEEKIMKKSIVNALTLIFALGIISASLIGCSAANNKTTDSQKTVGSDSTTSSDAEVDTDTNIYYTGDPVTLKALADVTPHAEILAFIEPVLEAQGITIDIVSTAADATWNEKTANGEVDFNFDQHVPYLESYNEINGTDLVSVGAVHVEPITAYSDKYDALADVPDDASIVIPNDATNEYRALKILEEAGFITLDPAVDDSLQADIGDITEYIKPVTITEIDSIQIIGLAADFDIFITNTNKALEAGLDTSKYLFRESADSPYANVIVTAADRATDPAILAVVAALQSDETRAFIEEHYNGAVVPATLD